MNILKLVEIAEKSAHCMRTAIDRMDIQYNDVWNQLEARVWYDNKTIIDIIEINDVKHLFDIPRGDYEVRLLYEASPMNYKVEKIYYQEDWCEFMYKLDMDNLESEEDAMYDNRELL